MKRLRILQHTVVGILGGAICAAPAFPADQPQWGERLTRNMVSAETGLPATFDPASGENVAWSVDLGSNAYGPPSIAQGHVLIGANNTLRRDPRHDGDRGVLLCLDEADGHLQWQLVVPRLTDDKYKDWPMIGMSSPPTIEGDRVYTVTNRFEVVCLDLNGQLNGNDGPFVDESTHMVPAGDAPMALGAMDADILWVLDMQTDIGIHPHDAAYSSILLDGPYLYVNTGNGVDNTHQVIQSPDSPSLIVIEKTTGRLVAHDAERMGPAIIHGTWSSPSIGVVAGKRCVFFGGGNGVCYAFESLDPHAVPASDQPLNCVWRFDGDPTAPKENVHDYLNSREVSPSNIKGMPVFYKDRVYVTVGGDIWWGKEQSWLKCIDASQSGEITSSGELWSFSMKHHSSSTSAIADGLLFITDCSGQLHCLDAERGQEWWSHELKRDIWGSPLVADGKVYVGSAGGDFCILTAAREKQVLSTIDLDAPIASTPVAANGVLYVATQKRLFALKADTP